MAFAARFAHQPGRFNASLLVTKNIIDKLTNFNE